MKRGDTWYVNVRCTYKGRSLRIRKSIGTRRRDAVAAEVQIRAQIAAGTYVPEDEQLPQPPPPRRPSFEDFALDEFLPWCQSNRSETHYVQQERILKQHLIPVIGGLRMDEISQKRIEDYCQGRRGKRFQSGKHRKRVKPATVNRELFCLKAVMRKAVEWGLLELSPAQPIKPFREIPHKPRLLSQAEVKRLLDALPDHLRALGAVVAYAGLRRAEAFYLRWQDVDLPNGELNVTSREERHTKSYKSRRIPMHPDLVTYLRQHPRRLGCRYVFPNKAGKPYYKIDRQLDEAAERAGIPEGKVRLQQIRHTFCSHAQMSGIPASTVQGWMGHQSVNTTRIYTHVSPEHERVVIHRLGYEDTDEEQGASHEEGQS